MRRRDDNTCKLFKNLEDDTEFRYWNGINEYIKGYGIKVIG